MIICFFVIGYEIEEETGTGEIIPDTTTTGSIEVVDTQIITEEEFLEEEIPEEVIEEEEEIELEGRLIYDANGNMIGNMLNNKRQYIYSYDYKNRLVKIEKNIYKKVNGSETDEIEHKQKIVQISYDVLGRRIQKLFNNGSYRNYIYANQHVILEENYSKKDKLKNSKQFTYSDSLDDVLSMKLIENKTRKIEEEYVNKKGVTKTRKIKEQYTETNTYYYQKDHLGSIIAITDETGTIVEEYSYDIFGKPYTKKSDGTITRLKKSPIGNTRMYTGREYDRGLKLYYNRARYYNPQLGRFISRDPIDIADDVNLYAYVGNNPIMYIDLFGTEKKNTIEQPSITILVMRDVKAWSDGMTLVMLPGLATPLAPAAGLGIAVTGGVSLTLGVAEGFIEKDPIKVLKEAVMFGGGKILGSTLKIVAKVPSVKFNFTSYRYHGYYSPNKYGFISNATGRTSNMLSNLGGFIATSFGGLFD